MWADRRAKRRAACKTAGYAAPINFLLGSDHIRGLLETSGANVLVTFGPHPQLDIWEKSLELKRQMPDLTLVRVAPPGTTASACHVETRLGIK